MTMTTVAAAVATAPNAAPTPLADLEFALTDEEIASANILQFDPDAAIAHPPAVIAPAPLAPRFLTVPGDAYSRTTWTRIAVGLLGGRPADALDRFIALRSRPRA